jgi:formate-dependent nitrite reductase cytochrome c552 subunit
MICHSEIYGWFRNSGHPYKVNEVVDSMVPEYPFSTIDGALEMIDDDDLPGPDEGDAADPNLGNTDNALGTPESYDDISFVIGGFGWKSRWMDADGFIVTGSAVQYNLETEAMSAYHNNEQGKKFNCGNCHTTGWRRYTSEEGDDRNLNRQNDLPGIEGTFAFTGIQCESCHGAGSEHIAGPTSENIVRIAEPRTTEDFLADDMAYGKAVACSECHVRESEKDYPTYEGGPGRILASGGLIRHHEQYEEMLGINPDDVEGGPTGPHSSFACITCHDPHTTTKYMAISGDPPGMNVSCTDCHDAAEYEITEGGMAGLDCTTCHMPLLAKSAVKHDAVGSGPATGDIKTHIFRIDLSAENQFTEDGKYAYPWITGDFACNICHNGEDAFAITSPNGMTIHN